jgi:hypothetical protein
MRWWSLIGGAGLVMRTCYVVAALLLAFGSIGAEARVRHWRSAGAEHGSVVTDGSSVRITDIGEVITPPSVLNMPTPTPRETPLVRPATGTGDAVRKP